MTATLTRPSTFTSNAGASSTACDLRLPQDLSHLTDETLVGHLRRYERESVFIRGKVSSVTVVADHQSLTGYGFVVVRVNTTGGFVTLIDWPRNEFYRHLCALQKRDEIGWIVAPIEWNQAKAYPFMRDGHGRPYSIFYRGSKIVDLDSYRLIAKSIHDDALKMSAAVAGHQRLLNGSRLGIPRGYFEARAIEKCLESATHRFKHVTNDPVAFFPEGIEG